mmetsp:Transcript_4516/g.17099  ORF Transcript_4516/g.17099 Transcript_4516/m.17099 type:complete len:105 (-) Transcript_4516:132-446(-)
MRRLKSSQTVCVTSTASLVSNQFSSMTHIKNSTISQQSQQYSKKKGVAKADAPLWCQFPHCAPLQLSHTNKTPAYPKTNPTKLPPTILITSIQTYAPNNMTRSG